MSGLFIPWETMPESCIECPCIDERRQRCGADQRDLRFEDVYVERRPDCPARFVEEEK